MWVHQDWMSGHWELGLGRGMASSAEVNWDGGTLLVSFRHEQMA